MRSIREDYKLKNFKSKMQDNKKENTRKEEREIIYPDSAFEAEEMLLRKELEDMEK